MDEKKPVVLIRRTDVEELLGQFNEHAHSSWSNWLSTKIQELPTLTVDGTAGGIMMADVDMKEVTTKLFHSIARSLDQLTMNLRAQLEADCTAKELVTNADWIRSMTDEELQKVLEDGWPCNIYDGSCPDDNCRKCISRWLKASKGVNPKGENRND
jgi:hypothetical protein